MLDRMVQEEISMTIYRAANSVIEAMGQFERPAMLLRPRLFPDGNQWCALYGDDLQMGIAGFGSTADEALRAFDRAMHEPLPTSDGLREEGEGSE